MLVLVMGAVLAPGKRTVSACLRMTGRAAANNFSSYHQILNRARWDSHAVARRLLVMIIDRLVPEGPVVIGMEDTIERRWSRSRVDVEVQGGAVRGIDLDMSQQLRVITVVGRCQPRQPT